MTAPPRTYRFSITVSVDAEDPGYNDPEWVADAATGALANVYGYDCFFDEIVEVELATPRSLGASDPRPIVDTNHDQE